jgi:hypothetical protein
MRSFEIVISRFNEPLDWTLTAPFVYYKYIVYNKGLNDNFEKKQVSKIIQLENVGKDIHTYLNHIIQNYDSLSEIVMFLPASMNLIHKRDKATTLLETTASRNFEYAIFLGEQTESVQTYFENFVLDHWKSTTAENLRLNPNTSLIQCPIRPYGKWYEHHFPNKLTKWWGYNNVFSVDRRDILQHPKEYYMNLIKGISTANDTEEAHYFERSWEAIFGPFTYTQPMYKRM